MTSYPWSRDPAENINNDYFAAGGGVGEGMKKALGRPVDYAVNHDPEAIAMYEANHPGTKTLVQNVWDVDPTRMDKQRRPWDFWWLSPDCRHFSKAKGGKPVDRRVRSLANVAVYVPKALGPKRAPRIIGLENVEEFAQWGPLLSDDTPNPAKKGFSFRRWWKQLEGLGYELEMREIRACNFGVPTSRNRLIIIGRRDGLPIRWPEYTHGPGLQPYRTAAECIDWSIPMCSIFYTQEQANAWARFHGVHPPRRPLKEKTLARTARGVIRYIINNPTPFIVPLTHEGGLNRAYSVDEPFKTITGAHRGEFALVQAFLARHYGGHENDGAELLQPIPTITSQDHHALVTAHIQRDFGQSVGQDIRLPIGTITPDGGGKAALIASSLIKLKGTCRDGQPIDAPLHTVQAGGMHYAAVTAFLLKYYGTDQDPRLEQPLDTQTTKHRFGLITVHIHGEPYVIVDIRMRMLKPRELFRAHGFREDYIIDPLVTKMVRGKLVTKPMTQTAQIRMVGNSVPPDVAEKMVRANYYDADDVERVA